MSLCSFSKVSAYALSFAGTLVACSANVGTTGEPTATIPQALSTSGSFLVVYN